MIERVCVVGAGVIGSLFAGHLGRVADVSVLCRRGGHARELNEHGLRVSGKAEFVARVTAASSAAELPPPELVVVATKAGGLEAAASSLQGQWPDAAVMTVLNGLGAEEVVRRHGDWALISAVTFISGTKHSDTHVEYILDTETWLGPYGDAPLALAEQAGELIARSGLKVEVLPDLRPAQWSKLVFNATVNGVAALTGLPHDFHFAEEDEAGQLGRLVHALIDEGKAVARAAGVELHDDPWEMNVLATRRGSAHVPSMLEDVEAGRPTEVELINGALIREARQHGVDAPLQEAVYGLVLGRESAYLRPDET
jgi:2-dehydropantoate 2-reductase